MSESRSYYSVGTDDNSIVGINRLEKPTPGTISYLLTEQQAARVKALIREDRDVWRMLGDNEHVERCHCRGGQIQYTETGNTQFRICVECGKPWDIKQRNP